ncbi:patatin-like phospholipase family protein [Victivallis sp. Marseille-Q1083]|uniref:patatin-like phospholipase family protein n=1 Tax=Victivallis sp. Marseille-Q1083 TaxID=2717288 RepID=UPI001588845F|nr:patatin-like phospholipase family protein [Victivallis sp. Marseille-Q1083]
MKTLCIINGGGCRQIECATGVLLALDASGVKFDEYRGSSAGAIVAALHGSGLTAEAMAKLIRSTPVGELFRPAVSALLPVGRRDYIYDADGMFELLQSRLPAGPLRHVRVAVTRLPDYAAMMCDATPATVMASAAFPEIFSPVKIGDDYFIDGGVKNMIPTPKISEIGGYERIYMILCCDDAVAAAMPDNKIGRAAAAMLATMERETTQIYEAGWPELDNVTMIHVPPFPSSLFAWSDQNGLIEHARQYAEKVLKGEK